MAKSKAVDGVTKQQVPQGDSLFAVRCENKGGKEMIIRGTTPTMTFGLPFDTEMIALGYVTVQQNDVTIIEKPLSECDCDGRTVSAKLAQEDTLKLASDSNAEIRLVVKTLGGDRLESFKIIERVADTSKEGVI